MFSYPLAPYPTQHAASSYQQLSTDASHDTLKKTYKKFVADLAELHGYTRTATKQWWTFDWYRENIFTKK